jgi:hypothetical protein
MATGFKLTPAEGLALVGVLRDNLSVVQVATVLLTALGPRRASMALKGNLSMKLTQEELVAVLRETAALVLGKTTAEKVTRVALAARPAFGSQERYAEAIGYAKTKLKAVVLRIQQASMVSTTRPDLDNHPYTITGYGPVNAWWQLDDSVLTKILTRMQQKNVRVFVVEALGNAGEDVLGIPEKMARVQAKYQFVLGLCDKLGLWFNPVVFNDNAGDGAYSNGGVKLAQRMAPARAFVDWIAQQGHQHCVFITPVAETQTDAGRQLQSYAAKVLGAQGFRLCTNDPSRPKGNASWSQDYCYHNMSVTDWPPDRRAYVLSDTGPAIRQLSGGSLNGPGQPDAVRNWVAAGVARGQRLVAFYEFQYAGYNEACIDALAAPVAAETGGSVVPVPVDGLKPSEVNWLGPNFSNAKITKQLLTPKIKGNRLYFGLSEPLGWPKSGEKQVDALGFLIRKIGGVYRGGKVEWCVSSRGWYDIRTNVLDGYNGSTMPVSGETVWCGLGHPKNGSECSTIVAVEWP